MNNQDYINDIYSKERTVNNISVKYTRPHPENKNLPDRFVSIKPNMHNGVVDLEVSVNGGNSQSICLDHHILDMLGQVIKDYNDLGEVYPICFKGNLDEL